MRYTRECALPTCKAAFKTNRHWQRFCCKSHQRLYWANIQTIKYGMNRRLEELEKEQERMKKKLGMDK